jgi:hypothetical protein
MHITLEANITLQLGFRNFWQQWSKSNSPWWFEDLKGSMTARDRLEFQNAPCGDASTLQNKEAKRRQ